ncbi:MAG: RecX family transcriptional regulator [Kiloniellales bacterium]
MHDGRPRRTGRRGPHKATEQNLWRAALTYLRRTASSADNLERVLMRRVERSARAHGTDRKQGAAAVSAIMRRLGRAGLIDDRRYAEARAAALVERGISTRGIRARLTAKGVAPEVIEQALGALAGGADEAELRAARGLARRRRLGPYRLAGERARHR